MTNQAFKLFDSRGYITQFNSLEKAKSYAEWVADGQLLWKEEGDKHIDIFSDLGFYIIHIQL